MQYRRCLAVLFALGCSSASLVPPGGPHDMAIPFTGDMTGSTTLSLSIGPVPVPPGMDHTVCSTFRLSNTTPIDVVQIDATLLPGSHHLILYKSTDTVENKGPYDCAPLQTSSGIPLYIAETQNNNHLPLPAGVAYHLDAGQMVKLEAHYINASTSQINGSGTVTLTLGAPATYQAADIMFCGSVTPLYNGFPGATGVPPGMSSLPPAFYAVPAGIKMFGLTTHEHSRGSLMTVDKSTSTAPGTNLTMGTPWDNPPFVVWDTAHVVTFNPGEGLRWQCNYDNPTTNTYYFGESGLTNEMCFFWAYYYPSVGHFISMNDCWR